MNTTGLANNLVSESWLPTLGKLQEPCTKGLLFHLDLTTSIGLGIFNLGKNLSNISANTSMRHESLNDSLNMEIRINYRNKNKLE